MSVAGIRIGGSLLALLLVAGSGVVVAAAEHTIPGQLSGLYALLNEHRLLAPLLFVLIYGVVVVMFLPGSLLCLVGGALFGTGLGAVLNVIGATLGSTLAFLIARHLAAEQVERHMGKTLRRLKQGVEAEGWRFVAMVRLLPIVPYDLSSYAFGLCRIPLGHLIVANALCLFPRLTVYAYIGHKGIELAGKEGDQLLNLISLFTLFIAILLLPPIYHRLRRPQRP